MDVSAAVVGQHPSHERAVRGSVLLLLFLLLSRATLTPLEVAVGAWLCDMSLRCSTRGYALGGGVAGRAPQYRAGGRLTWT